MNNLTTRPAFVRNVAVATVNGIITLILLLIAPLGLFAVLVNTVLVTVSTFVVSTLMDIVVVWLLAPSHPSKKFSHRQHRTSFDPTKEIERSKRD